MATNPDNGIGTNGAYGGRTSVDAFNDNLAVYNGRGILSGFEVTPNAGMSVAIGGDGTTRDVAIAEDNIGNKTTIDNRLGSPIVLNIAGAPASNSRIDAIVAYVDNPAQGSATVTDNPGACGLIDVQGSVASTPTKPTEADIRSAITADGASGSTAYFVILGYVTVANSTTDITSNMIEQGANVGISVNAITDGSITSDKIDWTTPSFNVRAFNVGRNGGTYSYTFNINRSTGAGITLFVAGRTSIGGLYIANAWAEVIPLNAVPNMNVSATGGVEANMDTVTVTFTNNNSAATFPFMAVTSR